MGGEEKQDKVRRTTRHEAVRSKRGGGVRKGGAGHGEQKRQRTMREQSGKACTHHTALHRVPRGVAYRLMPAHRQRQVSPRRARNEKRTSLALGPQELFRWSECSGRVLWRAAFSHPSCADVEVDAARIDLAGRRKRRCSGFVPRCLGAWTGRTPQPIWQWRGASTKGWPRRSRQSAYVL